MHADLKINKQIKRIRKAKTEDLHLHADLKNNKKNKKSKNRRSALHADLIRKAKTIDLHLHADLISISTFIGKQVV